MARKPYERRQPHYCRPSISPWNRSPAASNRPHSAGLFRRQLFHLESHVILVFDAYQVARAQTLEAFFVGLAVQADELRCSRRPEAIILIDFLEHILLVGGLSAFHRNRHIT